MPAHTSDAGIRGIRANYNLMVVAGVSRKVSVCPFPFHAHGNGTPSFSIFLDRKDGVLKFHCHGSCGVKGDVVDYVGYMNMGESYDPSSPDHVRAAISLLRAGYEASPVELKPQEKKELPRDLWEMFPLGDEVIKYGKKRGLTPETLQAFGVGQADNKSLTAALERLGEDASWVKNKIFMSMPTFHFGKLMMVKLRNIDAENRGRFIVIPGSSPGIFGFHNIYNQPFPIAIVKGEIPVMFLWQRGIEHVAAPSAGEGMIDEKWSVFASYATNRIVIGDNDPERVKEKLAEAYRKRCKVFGAKLYFPPPQFKDVDSWGLQDDSAISTIKSWMYEGVSL